MTPTQIIVAIGAINELIKLINDAIKSARARGEWTDTQEAEFAAKLEQVTAQEHWQIKS